MRNRFREVTALVAAAVSLACLAACQREEPFLPEYPVIDLLIEGGTVIDGRGGTPFAADVAVVGGTIAFVGEAALTAADRAERVRLRIDAAGRVVSPGFIDLHAHGDPLETPAFENFLAMGVTTISLGQDGASPAVLPLARWLDQVAENGIGTNLAMFVGHGTLRELAGIGRAAEPEPARLGAMLEMLDGTLAYTFGMTTGLEYNPGLAAGAAELGALAEVVGRRGRLIMSHLRSEDDDRLEASLAELLEQGRHARVHVSHLKSVFGKGEARAAEILALLEEARSAGIEVTADIYPYTASYTGISLLFPVWARTREQFEAAKRKRRDELAAWLRDRVERRNGPEATLLGTAPWTGRTLAEVAHERELPFEEVLIEDIGPNGASAAYFVMDEALQSRFLAAPWVGICSDGSPTGFHPRGHGTFARIIEEYVMERKLLTLEEAVRRMSSYPANLLGLPDRGVLAPGMKADLLVFDPERVRALATYTDPLQPAAGFDVVVVNGRLARRDGRLQEGLHGQVLVPAPAPAVAGAAS